VTLIETIAELGDEEAAVLLVLAKRLLAGQRQYGRLDLRNDARDFRRERAEEFADALIYGAILDVAGELKDARTSERPSNSDNPTPRGST
jgi:hypothetical protein